MIKKIFFISIFTLFSFQSFASDYPAINPVPGGIAVINLGDTFTKDTKVFFNKKRVLVRKTITGWQALIGLPLKLKIGRYLKPAKIAEGI